MTRDSSNSMAPLAGAGAARVGLVVSRYHNDVTGPLADAATEAFLAAGGRVDDLFRIDVPGAWELVPVAAAMAARRDVDGVACLGLILTGETTHDRWLAHGIAGGLADLAVQHTKPVAFGVLTCQSLEQATARAGGAHGNKGRETMEAVLGTIASLREVAAAPLDRPFESRTEGAPA